MLTKIMERTKDAVACGPSSVEADFRTLTGAIANGIFISHGKRLHYVNHAAETITGYVREDLLSMSFWDLVHPDCRELVLKRGGARHGGARRYEVRFLRRMATSGGSISVQR